MRRLMFTATALLLGCNACLAQISTIGSTAMGLPSTPGAIVTSALNGPSPFSATTQPGAADTTLAPVPLASDPTTPGTVLTCSTPTGQIAPGTPPVPTISFFGRVIFTSNVPKSAKNSVFAWNWWQFHAFFHHTPTSALPASEVGSRPKLASDPVSLPNSPIHSGAICSPSRYPPLRRICSRYACRGWPAGWNHG